MVGRNMYVRFQRSSGRWTSLVSPPSDKSADGLIESLTCDFEGRNAVYVEFGIDNSTFDFGFHSTSSELLRYG